MLNKCMVIGHLGADPSMRYLASGAAVTQFSVATSRKYKTGDGEQREDTEWFRVVTWNRLAETCAQYLQKGRLVYVEGRLQTRSWDGDDGQKHYMTELVAENVKFLGGARSEHEAGPVLAATGGAGGDIDPDNLPF
jgi:single-strand DNA-binding protein